MRISSPSRPDSGWAAIDAIVALLIIAVGFAAAAGAAAGALRAVARLDAAVAEICDAGNKNAEKTILLAAK